MAKVTRPNNAPEFSLLDKLVSYAPGASTIGLDPVIVSDLDGDKLTVKLEIISGAGRLVDAKGKFVTTLSFKGTEQQINDLLEDARISPRTGDSQIRVTVSDGRAEVSDTILVTSEVPNTLPTAVNDDFTLSEDAVLTVAATGVLGNDTDGENDTLSATLVSNVSNGTLSLNANGSFKYTPNADFNGVDTFTYTASDGKGNSNIATVTLTVDDLNDAPTATNIDQTIDYDLAAASVDLGDIVVADVDGDQITATLDVTSGGGTLSNDKGDQGTTFQVTGTAAEVSEALAKISYVPNAGADAAISVTVSDGVAADLTGEISLFGVIPFDFDRQADSPQMVDETIKGSAQTVEGSALGDFFRLKSDGHTVFAGAGADRFVIEGDDNTVYGGSGVDTITVSGDGNTVFAGSGNDVVTVTGTGNTIIGNGGDDKVSLGAGNTFKIVSLNDSQLLARDTISNFGTDSKIDLSELDSNVNAGGNNTFQSAQASGTVIANSVTWDYSATTNLTVIRADVDGNTVAELRIDLVGNIALTEDNFIL